MTAMLKSLRRPMARTLWGAMERERLHPPLIMRQGTAWYRYDRRLVKLNGGTTASKTLDLTGNGNTATQGTEANQLTYVQSAINGKPALQTDGNDGLVVSSTLFSTTAFTLFFVAHIVPDGATSQNTFRQFDSSAFPRYEIRAVNDTDRITLVVRGTTSTDLSAHSQVLTEGYYVVGIRYDGTVSAANRVRISVNGSSETLENENSAVSGVGGDFEIFRTGTNQPLSGTQIAEAWPINSAISDSDFEATENYMLARYGL